MKKETTNSEKIFNTYITKLLPIIYSTSRNHKGKIPNPMEIQAKNMNTRIN